MVFGPVRLPRSSTGPLPRLFSELVALSTSRPELRRSKYMADGGLIVSVGQSSSAGLPRQGFASFFTGALDTGWACTAAATVTRAIVLFSALRTGATLVRAVRVEVQDLSRLFDAGDGTTQLTREPHHPRHEVGVAGQLLRLVEKVVLEPGANVPAGDEAVRVDRQLGTAGRAHRPGRALGQPAAQVLDLLDLGRNARAGDADHELDPKRLLEQSLLEQLQREPDVARV